MDKVVLRYPRDAKIAVINRKGIVLPDGTVQWTSGPQFWLQKDAIVASYERGDDVDELELCLAAAGGTSG